MWVFAVCRKGVVPWEAGFWRVERSSSACFPELPRCSALQLCNFCPGPSRRPWALALPLGPRAAPGPSRRPCTHIPALIVPRRWHQLFAEMVREEVKQRQQEQQQQQQQQQQEEKEEEKGGDRRAAISEGLKLGRVPTKPGDLPVY
jgi:hypothetical protein